MKLCGLCRYKLRAKVTVEDVSQDYDVWTRFNPSPANQECQSEPRCLICAIDLTYLTMYSGNALTINLPYGVSLVMVNVLFCLLMFQTGRGTLLSCPLLASSFVWCCAGGWPQDPRLRELGQRAILPKGTDTGGNDQCQDPAAAYRRLRHSLGVAEGPSEIPQGVMLFITDPSASVAICFLARASSLKATSTSLIRAVVPATPPASVSGAHGEIA